MNGSSLRARTKALAPRFVVLGVRNLQMLVRRMRLPKTRQLFNHAASSPEYLASDQLGLLQKKYPFQAEYDYDPKSVEARGELRAREILRHTQSVQAQCFLELGCWDGMVSCSLHRRGKQTTAIDLRQEGFDKRAVDEGVTLIQMNAGDLQFDDESFDCVFSYDSFEHFRRPDVVLRNALRVLKKIGLLYLEFGPLYLSPYGQHAYRTITVPYCHLLFTRETLTEFTVAKRLEPIDFEHVNGWSVTEFRNVWAENAQRLTCISTREMLNLRHLDLVDTHPSCFRSKTGNFDDLIVESIKIIFQKTD